MSLDEIVMVPVPRRFLADVYQILGDKMSQQSLSEQPADQESSEHVEPGIARGYWDQQELRQLARGLRERDLVAPLAMSDLTAAEPGKRVTFPEILSVTGLSRGKARQQLAQLSWMLRDEFDNHDWPIGSRVTESSRLQYFYDDPDRASDWLAARTV